MYLWWFSFVQIFVKIQFLRREEDLILNLLSNKNFLFFLFQIGEEVAGMLDHKARVWVAQWVISHDDDDTDDDMDGNMDDDTDDNTDDDTEDDTDDDDNNPTGGHFFLSDRHSIIIYIYLYIYITFIIIIIIITIMIIIIIISSGLSTLVPMGGRSSYPWLQWPPKTGNTAWTFQLERFLWIGEGDLTLIIQK